MKLILPGVPIDKKLLLLLPGYVFVNCCVFTAATFALRTPTTLPVTALDATIPYLPSTIYIYLAHFPFAFLALYGLNDDRNFNRTIASIALVTLATAPIFIFWPTIMPPFRFPLPSGLTGFSLRCTNAVNAGFHNACPSMHAGYALLAALGFRDEQRHYFLPAMAFALLIAISTLTVKQHYLIDVPAGWAAAWACRAAVDRWVEFRFADAPLSSLAGEER